jgi:outer membrane receptor for ferrienterochelin and colicins
MSEMRLPSSLLRFACLMFLLPGSGPAADLHLMAQEQGSLLVEVKGAGAPMAGAVVQVSGIRATTDVKGRASFTVPAGRNTVRVSAGGFREVTVDADVAAGAASSVEVDLAPLVAIEEEVTVTATRSDRRIQDEPVRVEVVDRDDIEEKALMTPGSVAMLLGETTGLRVQTTSPSLGAANVRIQGLRGRYSQTLSDGLPLYGVQGDSLSLLQVPPLDLGQVEIIKGAASALYGPSALGGVINLVSMRPDTRQRQALLNASTQDAGDLSFWMAEPPAGRWAWTLIGGLHGQRAQDLDEDGWTDLPGFRRGVMRPRLFWDNGSGRTVFATVGLMSEDRRGGTTDDGVTPDGRPFREELGTRRVDGGAVARIALRSGRLLSFRGSFSHKSERREFGDVLERGGRFTGFGEAVYQGTHGSHSWLVGGALQQDHYRGRDLPAFNFNYVVPAVFAQDEVSISQQVTLGVSARVDRHSRYGTIASPRLSLLWKPQPGWNARLSAGTGFFAPTPFVEETEETGLSRLNSLSGLRAESARSASADVGWKGGPLEFTGTLFGSRVDHPVERRFVAADRVELANSDGPVRTWGTEILGRYKIEGFVLLLTHSHTRSTEREPGSLFRREVPLTPANVASFNAIWEGERWGRFGVEAYYIGRQPLEDNPYRERGRGHLLFGALAERRFGKIRLFVNLENLGNVRQTNWNPLVRPTRAPDGRWTVDAWAPLDGRVVNGGLRLMF